MLTTSTDHSLLRGCAILVALGLATPVVHAAPDPPKDTGASKKKLSKRAQALADAEKAARAKQLADVLKTAADERAQELARIQPLLDAGHFERAANHLLAAALAYSDPVLYLDSAEQFLAAADRKHPDALTRGRESVAAARALLAHPDDRKADEDSDIRTVRVARGSTDALLERGADIEQRLKARTEELREQRHGRHELAAGAALLTVGLTGAGVLAGGIVYRNARGRELAAIAGHESEYDLSALDAQGHRSSMMIGVGTAFTVVGVALGATLLALGARDLRGKAAPRRAHLQAAPTLGGLVLSGRF